MKKLLMLLSIIILSIFGITGLSDSASAASQTTETQTAKYGNYKIITTGTYSKYAKYSTTTSVTVNQYGIAITGITQKVDSVTWPKKVTNKGKPGIGLKASHGSKESAYAYGKFKLETLSTPIGSYHTSEAELSTYITVTKIDKAKKTVTFKIKRTTR
jgi:hypothetical protein